MWVPAQGVASKDRSKIKQPLPFIVDRGSAVNGDYVKQIVFQKNFHDFMLHFIDWNFGGCNRRIMKGFSLLRITKQVKVVRASTKTLHASVREKSGSSLEKVICVLYSQVECGDETLG